MESKPLLYGLIGFILGGLLVSIAAQTFNKPSQSMAESMHAATSQLAATTGDNFDKAFLTEMIMHHQGAVDMANAAVANAKHDEVKQLAKNIIAAQEKEITRMQQWQKEWGYTVDSASHTVH